MTTLTNSALVNLNLLDPKSLLGKIIFHIFLWCKMLYIWTSFIRKMKLKTLTNKQQDAKNSTLLSIAWKVTYKWIFHSKLFSTPLNPSDSFGGSFSGLIQFWECQGKHDYTCKKSVFELLPFLNVDLHEEDHINLIK